MTGAILTNKKFKIVFMISIFWIILDQITKFYVHSKFVLGESVIVVPNLFNITFVKNFGAAFGILAHSHPVLKFILLYSAPPLVCCFILFMIKRESFKSWYPIIALASILGGALGNFFDRIRLGYVVDHLDFHLNRFLTWPAFNFADVAIVLGTLYLFISSFTKLDRESF